MSCLAHCIITKVIFLIADTVFVGFFFSFSFHELLKKY